MIFWVSSFNDLAVSIFGSLLAASFCNALGTRKNKWIFWFFMLLIPLFQMGAYLTWDDGFLRKIYPIIVHFPLFLLLFFLTAKIRWSLVSILFAYLCCQLRRWAALFTTAIFSGGAVMQELMEIIITLPLLWMILRFVSPVIQLLEKESPKRQLQFAVIPALYYVFDYAAVVYTDILFSGAPVAVEFMPFVSCIAYLIFLLYDSAEKEKRNHLQQVKNTMDIQLSQAVGEIDALRKSQALAQQYRHDLRHHLQYVSACIENGQEKQAQSYISNIFQEIESQEVQQYCENEAANLILSAFVGRAEKEGIEIKIQGSMSATLHVFDGDLCVVLSNGLENALHACKPLVKEGKKCMIDVSFHEKVGKLFLQIQNPFAGKIRFQKGIPASDQPGHGIGVQSICAIVERYGGVYSFLARDGNFILRISL